MTVRILHYAFGGGYGHMVRSLALLRPIAAAAKVDARLLVNSPFAGSLSECLQPMRRIQIRRGPNDSPEAAAEFVSQVWSEFDPQCVIVDTFPRGLGGELVTLFERFPNVPRVLISRTLPQEYVEAYQLTDFVERNYALVIAPGEVSPFESLGVVQTAPFFYRSRGTVRPEEGRDVVLFVGTGTYDECEEVRHLAAEVSRHLPEGSVEFIGPESETFPLFDELAAARGVVAAAGYNLANEVKALGVPALLFARKRKYDDQSLRANSDFPSVQQAVEFVRRVWELPPRDVPDYENGVVRASSEVLQLLRSLSGSPE